MEGFRPEIGHNGALEVFSVQFVSAEGLKQDIVSFLQSRGYIKSAEDIGTNFSFRSFDENRIDLMLQYGNDRDNQSQTHYEGAKELKVQGLEPADIIYDSYFYNTPGGNPNFLRGGLAIYDAKKLRGVRNIPHASTPKEGYTFKDALIGVLKIDGAPGKRQRSEEI